MPRMLCGSGDRPLPNRPPPQKVPDSIDGVIIGMDASEKQHQEQVCCFSLLSECSCRTPHTNYQQVEGLHRLLRLGRPALGLSFALAVLGAVDGFWRPSGGSQWRSSPLWWPDHHSFYLPLSALSEATPHQINFCIAVPDLLSQNVLRLKLVRLDGKMEMMAGYLSLIRWVQVPFLRKR